MSWGSLVGPVLDNVAEQAEQVANIDHRASVIVVEPKSEVVVPCVLAWSTLLQGLTGNVVLSEDWTGGCAWRG